MWIRFGLILLLSMGLMACGAAPDSTPTPTATSTPSAPAATRTPTPSPTPRLTPTLRTPTSTETAMPNDTPIPNERPQNGANDEALPESGMARYLALAKQDLQKRLEITEAEIDLVSVENVTWSDGSLGCPRPGMMYTQALVDGYRIVLAVDEEQYFYHGGGGRDPFLCENRNRTVPPPTGLPRLDQ